MAKETRRTKEIGATLFSWELATVRRAALSRNAKLAAYVRDAVLAAAERDLKEAEPAELPSVAGIFDRQALIKETADEVFRRLAELAGEQKKDSAEDSA